jgi:hypothetical protein
LAVLEELTSEIALAEPVKRDYADLVRDHQLDDTPVLYRD